jgi:hypothetical protein
MKNAVAVIATIVVFFGCSCAQVSKPPFSGTWKLAPRLSKFGPYTDHAVDIYKVKLADPKLEIVHVFNGRQQTAVLVLDGKERNINPPDELRGKAYWDGDAVVVEKRQVVGNSVSSWTTRYSVSADGKQLTIRQHVLESPIAPRFDEELVYERP